MYFYNNIDSYIAFFLNVDFSPFIYLTNNKLYEIYEHLLCAEQKEIISSIIFSCKCQHKFHRADIYLSKYEQPTFEFPEFLS